MAKKSVAKRSAAKEATPDNKPVLTTSANKPLSVADTVGARAAAVATNRWATLKQTDGIFDHDPRKVVMNISIMENGPPEVDGDLAAEGNKAANDYTYQQVGPGVMIGMREGGEFESVDGFGWKDAADKAAHGNPNGPGAARIADMQ